MELRELKVIVTGGAQGMGAHFARRLAEAGATVAAGDVNEEKLAELPAGVHCRRLDVSDERDVQAFVADAADRGPVEVFGGKRRRRRERGEQDRDRTARHRGSPGCLKPAIHTGSES